MARPKTGRRPRLTITLPDDLLALVRADANAHTGGNTSEQIAAILRKHYAAAGAAVAPAQIRKG